MDLWQIDYEVSILTPVLWTQAYVYIETLREPAIDNGLTPFFFVVRDLRKF